jgi:hypothetical protein
MLVPFSTAMGGSRSCCARSAVIERQISPRPNAAMKLTASGVANWAGDDQVALVLAVVRVDDDDRTTWRTSSSTSSIAEIGLSRSRAAERT